MSVALKAPLILYSNKGCPWAQRATLSLQETGLPHRIHEIDLQNKPVWYNSKINPASKVPVLQIGGEDENSTGVVRIPESYVLLELISDISKERGSRSLAPEDIVEKAEARYFIERFNQIVQGNVIPIIFKDDAEKIADVVKGVDEIQKLLEEKVAKNGGPFYHGKEPGLADIGTIPFIGRLKAYARKDGLEPLSSSAAIQELFTSDKYKTFQTWSEAFFARDSWKKTFDEDSILSSTKTRLAKLKGN